MHVQSANVVSDSEFLPKPFPNLRFAKFGYRSEQIRWFLGGWRVVELRDLCVASAVDLLRLPHAIRPIRPLAPLPETIEFAENGSRTQQIAGWGEVLARNSKSEKTSPDCTCIYYG